MERSMRVVLLLIMFLAAIATITFSFGLCNGNPGWPPLCKDSERQALLMFKQDLKDPANRLSSWVAKEDSDCCSWTGVVCDHITGHIHELHLNSSDSDWEVNSYFGGRIPESTQLQSLNQSSFVGNELCGPPLNNNCSVNGVIPPPTVEQDGGGGYYLLGDKWFYVSLGLGFFTGFWIVLGSLLVNMPWSIPLSRLLNTIVLKLYHVIVEYV